MSTKDLNVSKGYQSQYQELKLDNLPVVGDIPSWLSGSFVSNGPAQFEIGNTPFKHWFDGFAMLKKFDFRAGKVSFQNNFLHSQQYTISHELDRLSRNDFSTYAKNSQWSQIKQGIKDFARGSSYDNCNVNTLCIADRFIAMTESSQALEFDITSLNTLGSFQFSDAIKNHIITAHPHWDTVTGETINVSIEIGKANRYHVYRTLPHSYKREVIATYVSDTLFYIHAFSITPRYVVLFKSPLTMNKLKLLLGAAFNDTLYWHKNKASSFIIIDRKNGDTYEIETDTFICLHGVNAYQKKHELILDLICHKEGNPYNNLYLPSLQSEHPNFPAGILKRYVLDVHARKCRHTILSNYHYEFPRINYKVANGKDYQFFYTSFIEKGNAFFSALEKFDLRTETNKQWKRENYYPGEGVFVPKPNSPIEDEGVLLFIAFNSITQCSSLIVLDALSMHQLAEVSLPFHLPFGLHGSFYHYKV